MPYLPVAIVKPGGMITALGRMRAALTLRFARRPWGDAGTGYRAQNECADPTNYFIRYTPQFVLLYCSFCEVGIKIQTSQMPLSWPTLF